MERPPATFLLSGRILTFLLLLTVVAVAAPGHAEDAPPLVIAGVPHIEQQPDFCGEACAAMWLARLGKPVTQGQVFDAARLDPTLGRGCYTVELKRALDSLGFKTGTTFYAVAPERAATDIQKQWHALLADLKGGVPSIVCMHYDDSPATTEHFRLVLGYDAAKDELIYHEPAEANGGYRRMQRALFLKLWPLRGAESFVIRLRLEAGTIKLPVASAGFTRADYAQHIMALRKKLPSKAFQVVWQPPFVVIGDEDLWTVQQRAEKTVKWATERLKKSYFGKDPTNILDIWLFKDSTSYNRHARQLFGAVPSTPYGYYSEGDKALVMNIATGGGTLVHEIVHPFMAANFPACPPWFNEGLGSLYEQSGESKGQIVGYTNWRLAGLQNAIKAKILPSFKELMAMDENTFYNHDRGDNYAQSRYLLFYLQEKGLLTGYYRDYTQAQDTDPTGYATLQKLLKESDMTAFQEQWEKYVMTLTYP